MTPMTMTRGPIVPAPSSSGVRPFRRPGLRFLLAAGLPLVFLAACDNGQTTSGSGGAAGSMTSGIGGAGGKGGLGGAGGHAASGGIGGAGNGGKGGSSSGGGGGGGTGGAAGSRGGAGGSTGGSAGGAAGGSAGAGGGGAGGAGGGASCATAVSGGACSTPGASCGGPCTDICQFCNVLTCTGGRWQGTESAPAPCFSCGSGKCQTLAQYCRTTEGGVAGAEPGYGCVAIPTACLSTRTCACLAQNNVPGICTVGGGGELMTLLQYP